MLEVLKFRDVGPSDELSVELRPRMNFLAGEALKVNQLLSCLANSAQVKRKLLTNYV